MTEQSKATPVEAQAVPDLPVARLLDVGFKYENGTHTPTVLVGFAPNDWSARDAFARSITRPTPTAADQPCPDGWVTQELERLFTASAGEVITLDMKRAANVALKVARGERWDDAASPAAAAGVPTEPLQQRVEPWLLACFGAEIAADTEERNHRFLEEALELVQACGCTASEAHQLVDYVFGRPVGERHQEAGGVMITLAALCRAQGIDMHEAGEVELARIWTMVEKIRAKQAAKPKHSPLPSSPVAPVGAPTRSMLINELVEQGQFYKRGEITEAQFISVVNHYVGMVQGCELATDATKQPRPHTLKVPQ